MTVRRPGASIAPSNNTCAHPHTRSLRLDGKISAGEDLVRSGKHLVLLEQETSLPLPLFSFYRLDKVQSEYKSIISG